MRTEEGIKSSDSNSEDNAFQIPELPASRSAAGLARSLATTTATAAAIDSSSCRSEGHRGNSQEAPDSPGCLAQYL